ncbi:RNA polymerase-associated protein LEO1 [Escovopsis weberi]|uniref:RNA polymerase-associated protein LEO1 n=1 Tax=Escovopsis weberi TaxID=150374 RepID=A0A0M9VRQ6_ESCWE|nr:RNA polymerase-associated protein LEO1 [Escovopsis weberi]
MSDSEDPIDPIDEEGGDDLFGDDFADDDDAAPRSHSPKRRAHAGDNDIHIDDDDLASDADADADADDDGEPRNRYDDDAHPHHETKERLVMAVPTYRHRIPRPEDGTLRVMRVPKFIKLLPEMYDPDTFQPSEFDVANALAEHPRHVVRVRRDVDTHELKSNANIYRWSDGSVTVSVGGEQYEITKKTLAPPAGQPYNELHDGHYYAAAAELGSNVLMTVGHITEQYNVRPNKAGGDTALSILAERMAQASKSSASSEMIIKTTRDPELQKKQAEMAEKERIKAQRRRENAAAKVDGGGGRVGGRGGGLSIGDLEGGRRAGAGGSARKRGAPGGSGKPKRRRPEYDSDDDLPQGAKRHEEYDLDDGFLVASDDELESEAEDDDEEEEDILDDDDDDDAPRSKRQRTRDAASDEDAEGDDVEPEASGRTRRRNVVDDDEE